VDMAVSFPQLPGMIAGRGRAEGLGL